MAYLTTPDNVKLNCTDTGGDGRPLVLVHGWPLSGESFRRNIGAFVDAGHRVVTYDRRGFGASDKPATGYDYDTLTSDLESVLEQLDLRGAVVLGFSMGGGEAARLGGRRNPRVAGLIFSGSITPALCITDDNPHGAMPLSGFEEMSNACRDDRDGFLDSFVTTFYSTAERGLLVSPEIREAALAIAHQSDPAAAVTTILLWATDLRGDCARIDVPTLVIHGEADQNVGFVASGERMPHHVPGASLVLIEEAPHGLNESHRTQWESSILDFVETLDPV